jgi:hypothetical protein
VDSGARWRAAAPPGTRRARHPPPSTSATSSVDRGWALGDGHVDAPRKYPASCRRRYRSAGSGATKALRATESFAGVTGNGARALHLGALMTSVSCSPHAHEYASASRDGAIAPRARLVVSPCSSPGRWPSPWVTVAPLQAQRADSTSARFHPRAAHHRGPWLRHRARSGARRERHLQARRAARAVGDLAAQAIERLPGVNMQGADPFGLYEWATRITMRGFQSSQVGQTFDGITLGDMSYGNFNGLNVGRAVDSDNLSDATVTQGGSALAPHRATTWGAWCSTRASTPPTRAASRCDRWWGRPAPVRSSLSSSPGSSPAGARRSRAT